MKKYFDFSRFGKYLGYDLVNAKNRYGLSAMITGVLLAVVFVFFQLFSLLFLGSFEQFPLPVKIISFACIMVVMTVAAPVKLYGFLTEKRAGSDWLLIPASSLEKFISMLVVLCIVLPLTVLVTSGLTDIILSAIFPTVYGDSIILNLKDIAVKTANFFKDNDHISVTTAGYASLLLNLWQPILIFALGAMIFKSGKVSKTILVCFLIASVLSWLIFICFSGFDMEVYLENLQISTERAQFLVNTYTNISYFLFFGVVMGAMYYKIKTLQH